METIRMGKRGTVVIPAKLRKQFGLEDGSLLVTEARDGGISLRPAVTVEIEIYTPERKAEFYLNNAVSKEDWDEAAGHIRALGLDPLKIPNTDPKMRESLPTNRELTTMFDRIESKHPARRSA
jgi:AbrB family looped-hinge helix DNA binding protein